MADNVPVLEATGIKVYYPVKQGLTGKKAYVKAVDGVDLTLKRGEIMGIVGESGCGKSTLGKAICKLIPKTAGTIKIDGEDISDYNDKKMREVRKKVQMIFQDPYASLNPRMTVHDIIAEPLIIHKLYKDNEDLHQKVMQLLLDVGLDTYHAERYPHEFSGGQRQRVGIARALATDPELIIADEPVSALDVSIQSQVLNLMKKLIRERNLTMIFVAHDLSVVEHISDRVGVMYLGDFVEMADADELYEKPLHPYTQALLDAVPMPDPTIKKERVLLEGSIPSALNPPSGCKFHTRCTKCMKVCSEKVPRRIDIDENHCVFCHLYDPDIEKTEVVYEAPVD